MRAAIALLVLTVVLGAVVPLLLHVTQRGHDALPYSVTQAFPPDKPIVPGEAFASTLAALVEHELGGFTGWRPNDVVIWGPTLWADNNSNRQLGIITAVRESTRVLKDHLTKVSSTEYDGNLVAADTAFRNDMTRLMLPSAESKLRDGVEALRRYVAGLRADPPMSKRIEGRNVELIRLFQTWGDLLGDAHASLFKETEADGSSVSATRTDDYYYHAQGVAHALQHLTAAIRREYAGEIDKRPAVDHLLGEIETALGRAASAKPLVVLDGGMSSIFANHRRNLDTTIVEARQKIYTVREELEK
jgi:hypothetical protein